MVGRPTSPLRPRVHVPQQEEKRSGWGGTGPGRRARGSGAAGVARPRRRGRARPCTLWPVAGSPTGDRRDSAPGADRLQWRDLPERFGPWKTVCERHRLWSADGTWERLLQQVQGAADIAGEIDWDISVDSTIVRAHQHAAVPGPDRRREGLGRSRGGFTSKLHLRADGRCRPLSLVVTGGQRADCTGSRRCCSSVRVMAAGGRERGCLPRGIQ
ncbi:IS5 family transposase [Streptomyces sp. NPDC055952]|uniref:IS5 family transposase n=1 Tax=Streptomyces sp. NPDC055952 TaxID=3345663 RepID=UPI0035DA0913